MISIYSELIEKGTFFLLISARVSIIILILPGISARYISQRNRIAISLIISYICLLSITSTDSMSTEHQNVFGLAIIFELITGTIYGIALRSIVFSLQIAGAIIAQSISLAQILGANVAHDAQSTISNILTVGGITFLIISGFFEDTIIRIIESYMVFPIGSNIDSHDVIQIVVHAFTTCVQIAVQLSMPFILLAAYYNMLLAVVNRAMPQLLVSFIGVPAVLAASFALFIGLAKPILTEWRLASYTYVQVIAP